MRFTFPKLISSCIPIFTVFLLSGCFSTLQTAKTSDGFSFTGGLYSSTIERHAYPESHYEDHYLLILMPRYGREATEKKVGLEAGIRLLTDRIDRSQSEKSVLLMLEEFKLQIPRNRYLDLAFGVELYLIYPGSIFILASKDLSKTFTLYGSGELFGGLYSITLGENKKGFYQKVTLGSEINFHRHFSALIEMENWFNTGWDARENLRFAAGVKVIPGKRGK